MRSLSIVGKSLTCTFEDIEIQAPALITIDRDFSGRINVEASSGDITAEWQKPDGIIEVVRIGVAQVNHSIDSINWKLTHIPINMKFKRTLNYDY